MKRWALLAATVVSISTPASAAAATGSFLPRVVLDPGHGGRYPGAVNCDYSFAGKDCLQEADVNLDIAIRATRALAAAGFVVVLTRAEDAAVLEPSRDIETWNESRSGGYRFARDGVQDVKDDLQARVNVANCATVVSACEAGDPDEADAFLSIHNNSCGGCGARGTESYRYDGSEQGQRLAAAVREEVVRRTGLEDRGTKEAAMYVLRWTRMPAALIEGAFLDQDDDARLLLRSRFRSKMARGIAAGATRYLCDIVGTPGDDVLEGTSSSEVICSLGGNDIVYGRRGDDRLIGGEGDDVLRGGRGFDLIAGGGGNDACYQGREVSPPETCET